MIQFKKYAGIYTLEVMHQLPISLEEAWNFFSSPENLAQITPPYMGFQITSPHQPKMYAGQIIGYRVNVLPGIKMNWVTEITHVKAKHYFVDNQRFGPYSMWHHEHFFEENDQGVLMRDKVSYKIPFGILGHLAQPILVKGQLKKIFQYRFDTLNKLFVK
ncbi:MAG: hypothetical protein AB8B61_04650 [Cyclobacteriaceae bacterium]